MHWLNLITVMQNALALDDEVDFLLAVIEDHLAIAVCIENGLSEATYALQDSVFLITLSKNRSIVTGFRCKPDGRLCQLRNVPMQPCRIHCQLLGPQRVCNQQQ